MHKITRLLLGLPGLGLVVFCVQAQTPANAPFQIRDKYYALLIAVNAYADPAINPLDYPRHDAESLREVLVKDYQFEPGHVRLLADPSRAQIYEAFEALGQTLEPNDNLLIFYAGHGDCNIPKRIGYWWPSDVRNNSNAQKISSVELQFLLEPIQCRHLLLVVDACYGGAIHKQRGPTPPAGGVPGMYAETSRKAITSGNMQPVPDQGVFAVSLIKTLQSNAYRYLPGQRLFSQVWERMVGRGTEQRPSYGPIEGLEDGGGEFIFVRRRAGIDDPEEEPAASPDVSPKPPPAPAGFTRKAEVAGQGITNVSLPVRKGDRVRIKAGGQVRVGTSVGVTTPAGKTHMVVLGFTVPIDPVYNLARQWPHGALLYRLATDAQWKLCGGSCGWVAPATGNLEISFQLNDSQQADNEGAYPLEITVTR